MVVAVVEEEMSSWLRTRIKSVYITRPFILMLKMGNLAAVSLFPLRRKALIFSFEGSGMSGKNGNSCFIKVPCGTVVSEVVENELWEEDYDDVEEFDESDTEGGQALDEQFDSQSGKRIELNRDGELVLIAKGGKAGLGNAVTSSGKYRNKSIVRIFWFW